MTPRRTNAAPLLEAEAEPIESREEPGDAELAVPQDAVPAAVSMFERLARDPSVDVAKLERLIAMQERILAHQAQAAFNSAFSQMQGELPEISEQGEIKVNGEVRSTYARYEDIIELVRPVLKHHCFSLRHRTEMMEDGKLKIVGILSHELGHSEQDEFVTAPDPSGSKNAIQALGSARSYGQRYTTISLLGIVTRGEDDDGAGTSQKAAPAAPKGYEDWLADLSAVADNGTSALMAAWNESSLDRRRHLTTHARATWEGLKRKASGVKS